jgi:hypothetical protein
MSRQTIAIGPAAALTPKDKPPRSPRTNVMCQPMPVTTLAGRFRGVTAITRKWNPGETERCRLKSPCRPSPRASAFSG